MHQIRPLRFNRRGLLRLRRLARADLPGLQWLRERPATCLIEEFAGSESLADLIDQAPQAQVGVELDHRLVGALLAAPSTWRPEPIAQPWDRLDTVAPALAIEAKGEVLRGCGAFWRGELTDEAITQVLTVGRKAVVQQLGLEGTYSVVEAPGWTEWRARMTPEAYLQQVHAGGFDDGAVRVLLENGWVMRGFWETSDRLQVVMWWGNRVR